MTKMDTPNLPLGPFASILAERIYALAAQRPSVDAPSLAGALGSSLDEIEPALAELRDLQLLQCADRSSGELVAVNPLSAALKLLAPAELELSSRAQAIDQLRSNMRQLLPLYQEGSASRGDSADLEIITDLDSVRILLEKLAAECESEVFTAQPGGGRDGRILDETAQRDRDLLERGVAMRTLYQHSARFDQPTCDYVRRLVSYGAEVRTTGTGFMRFIVYDRRTAVLSLVDNSQGALVVRVPALAEFIAQSFNWAWDAAEAFPTKTNQEDTQAISADVNKVLLRLLVNGIDDQRIARQLGLSLRTCQRRISDLMNRLGARNRLQAGYLISQYRLIDPSDLKDLA